MTMQNRKYLATAFILLALAVALGAFGSHLLKDKLSAHYFSVFETANRYHFIHALGLAIVVYIFGQGREGTTKVVTILFLSGIGLFSGSLYVLSIAEYIGLPQLKLMGAITPLGGISFIAAWLYSAYHILKNR